MPKKKEKKEKSTKKKKKSQINEVMMKRWMIGAIIVLVVFLGIVGIMDRNQKEEKKEEPSNQEQEWKGLDYYTMINYMSLDSLPEEYFAYFFQNDQLLRENLENRFKLYLAIRQAISNHPEEYEDTTKTLTISEEEVNRAAHTLFGDYEEVRQESISGNSCSYSNFKYDEKKKQYIQEPDDCENASEKNVFTILKDQQIGEEKVELTVGVAYVGVNYNPETDVLTYNYYTDKDMTNLIFTSTEYTMDDIIDKVDSFKFTFVKEEDHLIFEKVEKVITQ